jgi:hypothetical protein
MDTVMPLNLSNLGSGQNKPLLEPRAIYSSLPHRPWPYLRHEQGEVLERWFARRDDRDIVIKQNTGGGKTVVGLLICQSTINEGIGRAAYLAPDNYLAGQARREAGRLGIAVTDNPKDPAFRQRRAILVTTLAKMINGKSQFGVAGDGKTPLEMGVVVVDDAHAALAATEGLFKLEIPRTHEVYSQMLDLFTSDLYEQSMKRLADIREGDYSAVLRVPFWAWSDRQDRVMQIVHPHRSDSTFEWGWPLIGDVLKYCTVTITYHSIEIRPMCPPIRKIPSFATARRRVYLTATLADDSVLVTDLDADSTLVEHPVTPGRAADLGDRMILAPVQLNPNLDENAILDLARQYANGDRDGDGQQDSDPLNVVVLVPSDKAAERWRGIADAVLHVGDLEGGVEQLKASTGQLVVLVNKYDGVDLPGDACRLLILDGIPRPLDGAERREAAALSSSPALLARQVQRIEQGMGRGVRDTDDHCVVLLLGLDLADSLNDPAKIGLFSPSTRAQIELSREIAGQIEHKGLGEVREAIGLCLSRDPGWVGPSRRVLAEVEYDKTSVIRPEAVALRRAFNAAEVGQTSVAADILQNTVNNTHDPILRSWLTEQLAGYVHETEPGRAQQLLAKAVIDNPEILRPAAGVPVRKIKAVQPQAQAAAAYLGKHYSDGVSLVLGVRSLLDRIEWDNNRTDEAEAAWQELGKHLGFPSDRPEQMYGTGPDNLWILATDLYGVFELKTGASATFISKDYVDQLGGSIRWTEHEYGGQINAVPISVHPSNLVSNQATMPDGMRVVTPEKLETLKESVRSFAVALANGMGRWADPDQVAEELARFSLAGKSLVAKYTVPAKTEPH